MSKKQIKQAEQSPGAEGRVQPVARQPHEHNYNLNEFSHDDMGYWLTCTTCGHDECFDVSYKELMDMFYDT